MPMDQRLAQRSGNWRRPAHVRLLMKDDQVLDATLPHTPASSDVRSDDRVEGYNLARELLTIRHLGGNGSIV
jgi:hypothetical protein